MRIVRHDNKIKRVIFQEGGEVLIHRSTQSSAEDNRYNKKIFYMKGGFMLANKPDPTLIILLIQKERKWENITLCLKPFKESKL